jgi:hypothetical protein
MHPFQPQVQLPVSGKLLVMFKPNVAKKQVEEAVALVPGAKLEKYMATIGIASVSCPAGQEKHCNEEFSKLSAKAWPNNRQSILMPDPARAENYAGLCRIPPAVCNN